MGCLQETMKADLELRGYSLKTRHEYIRCARNFVGHYMRPADQLGEAEVRGFLLHLLRVRMLRPASHLMYLAAIKFLYTHTLRRPEVVHHIPRRSRRSSGGCGCRASERRPWRLTGEACGSRRPAPCRRVTSIAAG